MNVRRLGGWGSRAGSLDGLRDAGAVAARERGVALRDAKSWGARGARTRGCCGGELGWRAGLGLRERREVGLAVAGGDGVPGEVAFGARSGGGAHGGAACRVEG